MRDSVRRVPAPLAISGLLALVTVTAFWPVLGSDFTLYDDPSYVTDNAHVKAGLTWGGIVWAFSTPFTGIWHPLTWVSHMAVVQFFGLGPLPHHAVNLALHVVNTILLFIVFFRMTDAPWRSAFVAALFAIHPLHVESVAWVAERKDVLSGMFWILTIGAYVRYVRKPTWWSYLLVALGFVAGLMAKPMAVTLPFLLLVLDYWPLARWPAPVTLAALRPLVVEKLPLLVLSGMFSVVAYWAQWIEGNVADAQHVPIGGRLGNAVISYGRYLSRTFWPQDLAVFYPYQSGLDGQAAMLEALIVGTVLTGISVVVVVMSRRWRYPLVGWLWFLGTLVPVIGLVQFAQHAMADRYSYIPLIGLFVIVAWGASDLFAGRRLLRVAPAAAGCAVVGLLMALTWHQAHYWRDTVVLFEHALAVAPVNRVAHLQLGAAYARRGDLGAAIDHYSQALAMKPLSVEANNNFGIVLAQAGRFGDAEPRFLAALAIAPDDPRLHANLARVYRQQGAVAEAVTHYRVAARLDPDGWQVAYNLAWLLATTGDDRVRNPSEAIMLAERASSQTEHGHPNVLDTLAAAYAAAGRYQEAAEAARRAVRVASGRGQNGLARDIGARVRLYEAGQPYRTPLARPS